MATVESTELGLFVDGRSGWYKVVFTDATDLTIMENGTGFTLTGDQAGSKSASMVKIPRVETRNSKAVVCGEFTLNNGEWFEWEEILTATGLAGALFASETTATESAGFTGISVVNRSRAGADGNPVTNLRRTRCIRGSVPTGFVTAPTLILDADQETAGANVAVTDQVSGLTTKFNNSDGGGNDFKVVADRYGSGRNAIELELGEGIRNTDAIDVSGGVTYHFVIESDASVAGQDRFGEFYDGGGGIVLQGYQRMYVRSSGGAASTPSRGDTRYGVVKNAIQLYTLVVYTNGDRVLYVDGRPYCSEAGAAPAGTVTNKDWIKRQSGVGAGSIFVRRVYIIEDALTESEVYQDTDYFWNVIFANDEDLQGSLACFVSDTGSSSGTGRFNDPVDAITATTMRTSGGSWLDTGSTLNVRDMCVLAEAGSTVEIGPIVSVGRGDNEDPVYPTHIGAYGTISGTDLIPKLDYVDPDDGGSDVDIFAPAGDEFVLINLEIMSQNRNFRSDGTATAADDLREEVTLFSMVTAHKGLQLVNIVHSSLAHLVVDSAGSLTGQDWSFQNLECWNIANRNNYTTKSTEGVSGTEEASTFFLADREHVFMSNVIGYECGWDPDVVNATANRNLWGGAAFDGTATAQTALDNGYSRFGYFSSTYGCVSVNNLVNIRDASHDIQFREGGMLKDFVRWESEGTTFWADHDSYGENMYAEGSRGITGGNLIGYRGQQFSVTDATRLMVMKNVLANNAESTTTFPAFSFNADRTSASTYSPTGTANLRINNIAAVGFNTGIQFGTNAALLGSVTRSLVDLTGAPTPSLVVDFNNTGSMAGFDITDLGYDLDSATASTAWDYNGTAGTLASLRSSTSMGITPVIDFTSTGLGFDGRTLIDYCTTVLGFTKTDAGQTNAEELGEQWYEAFADAIRQGGDVSAYYASKALQWVFAGMQVDSAAQTLIEAQDTGAIWGVQEIPGIANITPADNATGVVNTQVVSVQFTEEIAYDQSAAVIRVVNASGTAVASAAVNAGTINVSDKTQWSISGLLSGLDDGSYHIEIEPDAFKSLQTGVRFPGISNSTDWNFTIGGAVVSSANRSRIRDGLRLR